MIYKVRIWGKVDCWELREYSFYDKEGIENLTNEEIKQEIYDHGTWNDTDIISTTDTGVNEIGEIEERGYGI